MLYKNLPEGELQKVLFVRGILDWLAAFVFWLKGDGKCICGKKERGMPLDYDMDGSMMFQYYSADGNKLYGSVMPAQILSMEDTDSEVLKVLKENLLEDDNPILVIAETKPL